MSEVSRNTKHSAAKVLKSIDGWGASSWLLTVFRIPILIAISSTIYSGNHEVAALLVFVFVAADILDGRLMLKANKEYRRHNETDRHIFDSVCDRVSVNLTYYFLYQFSSLALHVYIIISIREVFLISTALIACCSNGKVLKANMASRAGSVLVASVAIAQLKFDHVPLLLLIATIAISFMGIFQYFSLSQAKGWDYGRRERS